jgi:hypothetical protein
MTRAAALDWRTLPTPQTPLQRVSFMDACVRWLVQEPAAPGGADDLPAVGVYVGEGAPPDAEHLHGAVAVTMADLHARDPRRLRCFVCGEAGDGVGAVVSNPFAQRHISLLCRACRA